MVHIPRWQIVVVIVLIALGVAFAAPNLFDRKSLGGLPGWLPSDQINLGLDLRGGSYLLIEVDLEGVFEEQLDNLESGIRGVLRRQKIGYSNLEIRDNQVQLKLRDAERRDEVRRLILQDSPGLVVSTDSDGSVTSEFSEADLRQRRTAIMQQTLEVMNDRLNALGLTEPSIQRQGERRIIVQLPGVEDPERIKDIIGEPARMTFRFVLENVTPGVDRIPPGAEVLPVRPDESGVASRYVVEKRVMVSGENLVDAQSSFRDARPVVTFRFDTIGAKRFADATQKNVGRLFAIVLDEEVISAPVIREPILGGSGEISGTFTIQETQDLALLLRAGALPADLTFLEERTVGPGLGADSVAAGKIASALGLVFVIIFMASAYGLFGVMADIALIVNLILLVSVLSALQATLTLPGIAGIVLTIGMAVDANVLIFERIREEVRNGRGPVNAIDAGYRRAMTTIIDSNLTTLIAALLLFQFGSGPVKGFAVTLAIGLVTSMFTAIMVTRLMVVGWLRRKRPQALPV